MLRDFLLVARGLAECLLRTGKALGIAILQETPTGVLILSDSSVAPKASILTHALLGVPREGTCLAACTLEAPLEHGSRITT